MKVRYIGPSFGSDGVVYECLGVEDVRGVKALRILDNDLDDADRAAEDSDYILGYLYSAKRPGPAYDPQIYGSWEIVEDDEQGSLQKVINS